MNVEITRLPESRVALKIELSAQEVDEALERTYKQLVQQVNIPGFRKGKAPRPVLERLVGREVFLHEATDEAVRWGYRKAVDQEHLVPIDEAEISPGKDHDHLEPGEAFLFEATVAVKPEVQLPDYTSITVQREQAAVADADVDALLSDLQARNATLEPVVRPAQLHDVVTLNIVGRADGTEVLNNENAEFELVDEEKDEPDATLPGLSSELVGLNRGDIKELSLHLPELYSNQELAGKTLALRVLVKEIKRKVLPPVDDELAQSVSEFTSLADLRTALHSNLELERRMEGDEKLVAAAVEAVTSRTFVEIPPVLVDEEMDRMLDDMRQTFERAHLSFETYLETAGRSESDIRNDMRETATRNVKTSLVVSAIADAEHIEVSNDEVTAALEDVLRTANVSQGERRRLRTSTAVRSNIRNRIRRQRAIQRLVEVVGGGEEVSAQAAEAVADQTAAVAEDSEETVAVEAAG